MLLVLLVILLPTANRHGIDLVYLGVVLAVRMLLFVINVFTGVTLKGMTRMSWLFIGVLLELLVLLTVCPQIVRWLPQ
jgi:TRAP-type C4-dicarboxylate transport system permease large subunit